MAIIDDYAAIARRMKELKEVKAALEDRDDGRMGPRSKDGVVGRSRRVSPIVYMYGTTVLVEKGVIPTQTISTGDALQSYQGGFMPKREESQ